MVLWFTWREQIFLELLHKCWQQYGLETKSFLPWSTFYDHCKGWLPTVWMGLWSVCLNRRKCCWWSSLEVRHREAMQPRGTICHHRGRLLSNNKALLDRPMSLCGFRQSNPYPRRSHQACSSYLLRGVEAKYSIAWRWFIVGSSLNYWRLRNSSRRWIWTWLPADWFHRLWCRLEYSLFFWCWRYLKASWRIL